MPTINNLSALSSIAAADQLPFYSNANGDARKGSVNLLTEYLADGAMSNVTVSGYVRVEPVTFANLPAAATAGAGARAFCTDSNTATFAATVAGGGANSVPVYSDGTNWKVG